MRAVRVLVLVLTVIATGLVAGPAAAAPVVPVAAPGPAAVPPAVATTSPAATALQPEVVPAEAVRPAAPALVPGTPCMATARACVHLATNRAWLIRDGKVEYGPVPVRHGKRGWRTPPGVFRVTFKSINHRSRLFNGAPMPYSVFFNGGIAFHEGSLRSESHGCVRLKRADAKVFYRSLQRGDVVQVV